MTGNRMTCAECDELLSGYLENELDAGKRESVEAHAASCARCRGLMRDIDAIRQSAAALPELAPSRDLWQGIDARIQPAVVSIGAHRREVGISRRWLAVAAAALVVATSSVTYLATARSIGRGTARAGDSSTATVRVAGATVDAPAAAVVPTGESAAPMSDQRAALASRTASPPASPSELALSGEIARLQSVLRQRRSELDAGTVKVVEDNLALIDSAVRQARAALARDPASGFLNGQLDNALHKKVELLRTVALLPSST